MADYVLLQHGYIALKDTHTLCYITRYITIYMLHSYSNMTRAKNTTKQNLLHNIQYTQSEHNKYT